MSPFAAHFAAGEAYFSGIALLLSGLGLAWRSKRRAGGGEPETLEPRKAGGRVVRLLLIVGCLLAGFSSVPTPLWLVALFVVTATSCLLQRSSPSAMRTVSRVALVVVLLIAAALELSRQMEPSPLRADSKRLLYVIGDSISAGMGVREETWPQRLSQDRHLPAGLPPHRRHPGLPGPPPRDQSHRSRAQGRDQEDGHPALRRRSASR